jgi:hypothetical protein
MDSPSKFEKIGKAYVGHAVAIKSNSGAEFIILCPTKDEAVAAAISWGEVDIDPAHIKRAMLGPVVPAKAPSEEGN